MDTKVISSGVRYTRLPESYIRPESKRPRLSEVSDCENVPVIDLGCEDQSSLVRKNGDACEKYGFSQVTNHGVGLEAVPVEEKLKLSSDDPAKTMRLSTSFNVKKEKVNNWRDDLRLHCYPLEKHVSERPTNPPQFNPSSSSQNMINLLSSVEDVHGGVTVEMKEPMDSKLFASMLESSLSYWRQQKKRGVWIKLPIGFSNLVEPAVKYMEVDRTVIFSKILTGTDIKARLAVPTHALNHINMPEDDNYVYPEDLDGKKWRFQVYTRPTGHPKPAFTTDWLDFVKAKGLQIGDKVTFSKLDNEDEDEAGGARRYRIHATRSRAITLMGVEVVGWLDLPLP
ncbi:hypothetical protein QYF36_006780 [Acer negundo]|nr:hypothetical protein QYF36_006780 [Acer negundo]